MPINAQSKCRVCIVKCDFDFSISISIDLIYDSPRLPVTFVIILVCCLSPGLVVRVLSCCTHLCHNACANAAVVGDAEVQHHSRGSLKIVKPRTSEKSVEVCWCYWRGWLAGKKSQRQHLRVRRIFEVRCQTLPIHFPQRTYDASQRTNMCACTLVVR